MSKWWIRIATSTTTKKVQGIWKAKSGNLDTDSRDYMQKKYQAAMFWSIRRFMPEKWFSNEDVRDFAQECVDDAFVHINEYDSHNKFRTFLNKITLPKLKTLVTETSQRKEAEKSYIQEKYLQIKHKLPSEFRQRLLKEFRDDALQKLKEDDARAYEVFCLHDENHDNLPFAEVVKSPKLSPEFAGMTEANARQIYHRAKGQMKHILRDIYKGDTMLAKKLPIGKGLKSALAKETTKVNH
ncbi:MAG: hypothetical protein V1709_04275 [Planctomycetota bacterium]